MSLHEEDVPRVWYLAYFKNPQEDQVVTGVKVDCAHIVMWIGTLTFISSVSGRLQLIMYISENLLGNIFECTGTSFLRHNGVFALAFFYTDSWGVGPCCTTCTGLLCLVYILFQCVASSQFGVSSLWIVISLWWWKSFCFSSLSVHCVVCTWQLPGYLDCILLLTQAGLLSTWSHVWCDFGLYLNI